MKHITITKRIKTDKPYELQIWFKPPSARIWPIPFGQIPDLHIQLDSLDEIKNWIDKDDKGIAKAAIWDRVTGIVSEVDLTYLFIK